MGNVREQLAGMSRCDSSAEGTRLERMSHDISSRAGVRAGSGPCGRLAMQGGFVKCRRNRTGDREIGQGSDRYRSELRQVPVGNRTALGTTAFRIRTCSAFDARFPKLQGL
jgi:hypothetical protein